MFEAPRSPEPDDFERRLRELYEEAEGTTRVKEPSAAERAKAARKASRPKAPKAPKTPRTARPRKRGGIRPRLWACAVLVVAIAATIGWVRLTASHSIAGNDTQPIKNGPVPRLSMAGPGGPPADPFAGSPASGYANGAAGIIVPAARPAGTFSAAEVAAAYTRTRRLLIAIDLDWPTLQGGAPDAYTSLLVSQQRSTFVHGLDKIGLDKKGYTLSTRALITSFAPGSTQFLTRTVKVRGTMTAASAKDKYGRVILEVKANYLFVYAVEPPHQPADWMRVVVHTYGPVDFARWDDPGGSLEPWVLLSNDNSGGRCGIGDGFIHPAFPYTAPDKVKPSGAPVDPYSLSTGAPTSTCHPTTGT